MTLFRVPSPKNFAGLRHAPIIVYDEAAAWRIADRQRGMVVMLGPCPQYWIVCRADAARLEQAGHEWAKRPGKK